MRPIRRLSRRGSLRSFPAFRRDRDRPSATNAPSLANNSALARPMPEPAPVTISDPFLQPHVTFPPPCCVHQSFRSAAESAQPKRARQPNSCSMPRNRQRRAVGVAVQIDRRRFARAGQPADKARMQGGQILSPLQRRPFAPGRDIVEAMFGSLPPRSAASRHRRHPAHRSSP